MPRKPKSRKGRDGIHVWIPWTTYDKLKTLAAYAEAHPKALLPKTHAGLILKGLDEQINKRHIALDRYEKVERPAEGAL